MSGEYRCPKCNAALPFGKLTSECPKCGEGIPGSVWHAPDRPAKPGVWHRGANLLLGALWIILGAFLFWSSIYLRTLPVWFALVIGVSLVSAGLGVVHIRGASFPKAMAFFMACAVAAVAYGAGQEVLRPFALDFDMDNQRHLEHLGHLTYPSAALWFALNYCFVLPLVLGVLSVMLLRPRLGTGGDVPEQGRNIGRLLGAFVQYGLAVMFLSFAVLIQYAVSLRFVDLLASNLNFPVSLLLYFSAVAMVLARSKVAMGIAALAGLLALGAMWLVLAILVQMSFAK